MQNRGYNRLLLVFKEKGNVCVCVHIYIYIYMHTYTHICMYLKYLWKDNREIYILYFFVPL